MSFRVRAHVGFAVVIMGGGASCLSSNPSTSATSERLIDLTPGQQKALCDDLAQTLGGYGHTIYCVIEGGPSTNFMAAIDQATCMANMEALAQFAPNCGATVAQVTACVQSEAACGPGANGTPSSDCESTEAPACQPSRVRVVDGGID